MENSDSMIKNGNLKVTLKAENVTWFEFLHFSRFTNSLENGWNFKKYWKKRGLGALVDQGVAKPFITVWTENSLKRKADPTPRSKDFLLTRTISQRRQDTILSPASEIATMIEATLNTALWWNWNKHKSTTLGTHALLCYETPLAEVSEGQLKVDLLGFNQNSATIVELKQASNHADSPLMAFIEAICYGLQLVRCSKALRNELEDNGISAWQPTKVSLKIAAPENYWKHWLGNLSQLDEVEKSFGVILDAVNVGARKRDFFDVSCLMLRRDNLSFIE